MVRSFGLSFESTGVSIPATGRYCLATLMSSDRTKQICLWMTIYIYIIYIYIYRKSVYTRSFRYTTANLKVLLSYQSVSICAYRVIKNVTNLMGAPSWYNFKHSLHVHPLTKHSRNPPRVIKNNVNISFGGVRGVMVIVVGNRLGDTSSNPGRDWLHFTEH